LSQYRRQHLQRAIRIFALISLVFIVYVMVDFSTTDESTDKAKNYRIDLPELSLNQAYFFKLNQRQIVIVRHAASGQADDYFVAFASGTELGCPLQVQPDNTLQETCSQARWDFYGQPVVHDKGFTPLHVPVYNFCQDFSCLILRM